MLIKGMREGGESKTSLCYSRGLGASPKSFRERDSVLSACRVFVDY